MPLALEASAVDLADSISVAVGDARGNGQRTSQRTYPKQRRPRPRALNRGRSHSQLDLLDLGHEPAGVVGQEGDHDAEHGVTEAANVQDVGPLRGLGGSVWLDVEKGCK